MLSLPPDEMRRLGYALVDRLVEHADTLDALPPLRVGDAAELRAAVGGPPPEEPGDVDALLELLFDQVLPFGMRPDHPRFFARIPGPSNFVSVLADTAATGVNAFAGSWTSGSGVSAVELVVLDWLREICGLPEGADGVLVSGGSVGSLVALAAARTARFGDRAPEHAVAYVSSEGHASIPRALRLLGLQYEVVPARDDHRLHAEDVRAAIEADRDRTPFCVVATSGTTSTGAVDPLEELADAGTLAARRRRVRGAGRLFAEPSPASSAPTRSSWTRTSGSSSPTRRAACWCARAACSSGRSPCRASTCATRSATR